MYRKMKEMKREGYGSQFNTILYDDHCIKKIAKNEYGIEKIKKEILFYSYLRNNPVIFPLPYICSVEDNGYTMKYYKNHIPLYKVYSTYSSEKRASILNMIYTHLDRLHSTSHNVLKEVVERDVLYEVVTKIRTRYDSVCNNIAPYMFIDSVNSIKLLSFDTIMSRLREKILDYLNSKDSHTYSIIHGDCQFNNVLYNEEINDIVFIDPRGYFGLTDIYGLPEYDTAKVYFALSGYDIFDSMENCLLDIEGNNLRLPSISLEDSFLDCPLIIKYLLVSIWLGNAHCFKKNPEKAAFSYFYAIYLGTRVFNEEMSLIK
jgi:hypothetical protein